MESAELLADSFPWQQHETIKKDQEHTGDNKDAAVPDGPIDHPQPMAVRVQKDAEETTENVGGEPAPAINRPRETQGMQQPRG